MAYVVVTQWRAAPGRVGDLLEGARLATKVHTRLGGRVRMLQSTMAGPNTGILNYLVEFDDMAAYAKWSEQIIVDAEFAALLAKYVNVADPVGTVVSQSLLRDIAP